MYILPYNAVREDYLNALIQWTELLAQEKYTEALEMFQAYDYETDWTPELLESAVYTYGCPGLTREEAEKEFGTADYKVTSLLHNENKAKILEAVNISFFDSPISEKQANMWAVTEKNIIGMIHYDFVPLNGEMSDLTARFWIKKLDEESIALSFIDLHVM